MEIINHLLIMSQKSLHEELLLIFIVIVSSLISEEWMHAHVCNGLVFPVSSAGLSGITYSKFTLKPIKLCVLY
jgi:hypothetical protein